MTKTTAAAATDAAAIANPCLCSKYEVVLAEFDTPDGPDYTAETTGCVETTTREFAPGHDAKLKSLLIRAGIAGLAVRYGSTTGSAENAAAGFAFSYMVIQGIERGRAKAAAKADKKAAKADRPTRARKGSKAPAASAGDHVVAAIAGTETVEAPAEAPATTRIKIGRWEYDAVIDAAGDAHYTSGKGAPAVSVKGVYKLVG